MSPSENPVSARTLTFLALGGTIGTGIFVMAGMAARQIAGPAVIVSFLLAGLAIACAARCYADLAARAPAAGSAYGYARTFVSRPLAWMIGWNMIFQYGIAAGSVAQGWSHYLQDTLKALGIPLPLPPSVGAAPGMAPGALADLPAALAALAVSAAVLRGFRVGIGLNAVFVAIKLAVLALAIGLGAAYVRPENWTPFAPFGWGIRLPDAPGAPPQGMVAGAALAFYAYLGFEATTLFTQEARAPRRDIPVSILACVAACTLLYASLSAVLTGMVRWDRLSATAPVSEAFGQIGFPAAHLVVAAGALAAITSVLIVILLSFPRVLLAVGQGSVLTGATAEGPRSIHRATLAGGIAVALLGALVPLKTLGDIAVLSTLLTFVFIALLTLRLRWRETSGAARRAGAALVPLASLAFCALIAAGLPALAWGGIGVWLLVGLCLLPWARPQPLPVPAATAD